MPNSIKCKIKHLCHNGTLTERERDRILKALEQEPRWIPVSERLPEEEGLYLVSVKNDHKRRYSKTCWYMGRNHWFARQDVEAWMPLPEPYKTESEG